MRRACLAFVLLLPSCTPARQAACAAADGLFATDAHFDSCQLPSNALPCPTGFETRDEHGFFVVCSHTR